MHPTTCRPVSRYPMRLLHQPRRSASHRGRPATGLYWITSDATKDVYIVTGSGRQDPDPSSTPAAEHRHRRRRRLTSLTPQRTTSSPSTTSPSPPRHVRLTGSLPARCTARRITHDAAGRVLRARERRARVQVLRLVASAGRRRRPGITWDGDNVNRQRSSRAPRRCRRRRRPGRGRRRAPSTRYHYNGIAAVWANQRLEPAVGIGTRLIDVIIVHPSATVSAAPTPCVCVPVTSAGTTRLC